MARQSEIIIDSPETYTQSRDNDPSLSAPPFVNPLRHRVEPNHAAHVDPTSIGPALTQRPAAPDRAQEPAGQMLDHVLGSGTPAENLKVAYELLLELPHATGEQVFHALERARTSWGTLRKCGQYLWGKDFLPSLDGPKTPEAADAAQLRAELARVTAEVAARETDLAMGKIELRRQSERIAALERQLADGCKRLGMSAEEFELAFAMHQQAQESR